MLLIWMTCPSTFLSRIDFDASLVQKTKPIKLVSITERIFSELSLSILFPSRRIPALLIKLAIDDWIIIIFGNCVTQNQDKKFSIRALNPMLINSSLSTYTSIPPNFLTISPNTFTMSSSSDTSHRMAWKFFFSSSDK